MRTKALSPLADGDFELHLKNGVFRLSCQSIFTCTIKSRGVKTILSINIKRTKKNNLP